MQACPKCGHEFEPPKPKEYATSIQVIELGDVKRDSGEILTGPLRANLSENEKRFLTDRQKYGFTERNTVPQYRWYKDLVAKYLSRATAPSAAPSSKVYDKPLSDEEGIPF